MQTQGFRHIYRLLAICFLLLALRLWWLNSYRADDFIAMAQNQRMTSVGEYEYDRGSFLDRNGEELTNRAERVLLIFPTLLQGVGSSEILQLLAELDITPTVELTDLPLEKANEPFVAARGLSSSQSARLAEKIQGIDGLFCTVYHPRYPQNSLSPHLIGYVGKATAEEVAMLRLDGCYDSDYIGKSGLELQYDRVLRGLACDRLAATCDSHGRQTGTELRRLSATQKGTACNVHLTIDRSYQEICEAAMNGKVGAAVLMDVKNGDVLALSSTPGFDQTVGQVETQGDLYVNKALSYYPPASVFKLVLAAAAIEENITIENISIENIPIENITTEDTTPFCCTGAITIESGHTVHCWKSSGHGEEDMTAALGNSCNPYFIALGQQLGGDLIREYAWRLGLTEQILGGFSLNSVNMLDFNSAVPADVANVSIGEKGIRATPLMITRMLCAIANGGFLPEPRLVIDVEDTSGRVTQTVNSAQPRRVISAATANKLKNMLIQAVEVGTGSPVKSSLITIGGKTGTSQSFGVWFACFFPAEAPRFAMTVYVADGTSGGSDAGTVCREVAEKIALLENIASSSSV